ncbi:MAG: hypothetical protein PHX62_08460 [Bacilli bacterium]|nr:hypothetical protein [Bacilli bacterium]
MEDEKIQQILEDRIEDHETRLRKLETNSVEVKYELANINKSQAEMKSLFLEQNKEYTNYLNKFWEQITEFINSNKDNIDKVTEQKDSFLNSFYKKNEKLTICIITILSSLLGLKLLGIDVVGLLTK